MQRLNDAFLEREELTLSIAELSDAALLAEAEALCFPRDGWSEKMFCETMQGPVCTVYAVHDRHMSKIVAYCVVSNVCKEGEILNIAVIPEMRRCGMGKALLQWVIDRCEKVGTEKLYLEVRSSNAAAKGLYSSCGFKEIGKRRNYYSNPREDADILCREGK